ncbi:unnamed protein product [Moneuplotes crassus]|uniref:Uncharacterized protein n=1 Tax=Euplotes crassus TaxID=5936 RepID=A0AAD2CW08_EUPCR|nr:unnamed protein product [Moneuplotes crassus]
MEKPGDAECARAGNREMGLKKVGNRYEMVGLDDRDCISGDFGEDISLAVCKEARILGLYADCAQRSFVERVKQILDSLTSLKELLSLEDLISNGNDYFLDKKLDETCQSAINLLQKYQQNDLISDNKSNYKSNLESLITEEKKHHNEIEHVKSIMNSYPYEKMYLREWKKRITRSNTLKLNLKHQKDIDLIKSWKTVTLFGVRSLMIKNMNYQSLKAMKNFLLNCFPERLDKFDIETPGLSLKECKRCVKEIISVSHIIKIEVWLHKLQISKKQFMRIISAYQNKRTVLFSQCTFFLEGIPDFTHALNGSTLKELRLHSCCVIDHTASSKNLQGIEILLKGLSRSASFLKSLVLLHLSGFSIKKTPSLLQKLEQCGLAKCQIYFSM